MPDGKNAHGATAERRRYDIDSDLDRALENTFPASDPIAVGGATGTESPSRPIDRRAPIIDGDAVERARGSRRRQPSRI